MPALLTSLMVIVAGALGCPVRAQPTVEHSVQKVCRLPEQPGNAHHTDGDESSCNYLARATGAATYYYGCLIDNMVYIWAPAARTSQNPVATAASNVLSSPQGTPGRYGDEYTACAEAYHRR